MKIKMLNFIINYLNTNLHSDKNKNYILNDWENFYKS